MTLYPSLVRLRWWKRKPIAQVIAQEIATPVPHAALQIMEILDHIIDFLEDDRGALRQCALVCNLWAMSAGRYIYSSIFLNPTYFTTIPQKYRQPYNPMQRWPLARRQLENAVHVNLNMWDETLPPSLIEGACPRDLPVQLLGAVLEFFPRVHHLSLNCWSSFASDSVTPRPLVPRESLQLATTSSGLPMLESLRIMGYTIHKDHKSLANMLAELGEVRKLVLAFNEFRFKYSPVRPIQPAEPDPQTTHSKIRQLEVQCQYAWDPEDAAYFFEQVLPSLDTSMVESFYLRNYPPYGLGGLLGWFINNRLPNLQDLTIRIDKQALSPSRECST